MEISQTVCAVVVTYNRKKLLIECLEALKKQSRKLDTICIIDNFSNDGTEEVLYQNNYINEKPPHTLTYPWETEHTTEHIKINYIKMNNNTGGAGGFHEGVKRAYEKGYDWLWIMDDDGLTTTNTLENLLKSANNSNLQVVGPTIICRDNREYLFAPFNNMKTEQYFNKYGNNSIITDKLPTFNGSLYNKSVIEKVGFPDKDLFIWGDEDDYRFRVKYSFEVGVTTAAIYFHPQLFHWEYKYFLNKKFRYSIHPTWKIYYKIRNLTYLRIYKNQKRNFGVWKVYFLNIYINLAFRKENKYLSCYYHTKALFDAVFKKLGKRIDFIK